MIIGAYFQTGECLVCPIDQAAQMMGCSEYLLKKSLDGNHAFPGVTICKMANDSVFRIPKEVPKLRK